MKLKPLHVSVFVLVAIVLLAWSQLAASADSRTVIGPRNVPLAEGADALRAGDAEEGVRLSLRGLEMAQGNHELKSAHSNLCAGYLLMDKPLTALKHCDEAIALDPGFWRAYNNRALVYLRLDRFDESEADIAKGQALRPSSAKLRETKGMLIDATTARDEDDADH